MKSHLLKLITIVYIFTGLNLFAQKAWGVSITDKDKKEVIETIRKTIRNKVMYIDGAPELGDIRQIAAYWKFINSAGQKKLRGKSDLYKLRQKALRSTNSSEYKESVNDLLSKVFSHFRIDEASKYLEKKIKKPLQSLGLQFKKSDSESLYQKYEVTSVMKGGEFAKVGVQGWDTFYLPNRKQDVRGTNPRTCIRDIVTCDDLIKMIGENETIIKEIERQRFPESNWFVDTWNLFFLRKNSPKHNINVRFRTQADKDFSPDNSYKSEDVFKNGISKAIITKGAKRSDKYYKFTVPTFGREYKGSEIAAILECVVDHGLNYLIIDLRDNLGGRRGNEAHLISYFIPKGTPYLVRISRKQWDQYRSTPEYQSIMDEYLQKGKRLDQDFGKKVVQYMETHEPDSISKVTLDNPQFDALSNKKVVVLINSCTASAAEVVAGVLRLSLGDRCVLIGQKSSGAVLTALSEDLSQVGGGFLVKYPYQDVFLVNGFRIEGQGLRPDIQIPEGSNEEKYIQAANRWFAGFESVAPYNFEYEFPSLLDHIKYGEKYLKEVFLRQ